MSVYLPDLIARVEAAAEAVADARRGRQSSPSPRGGWREMLMVAASGTAVKLG